MSKDPDSRYQLGFPDVPIGTRVRQRMRFAPRHQAVRRKLSPASTALSLFVARDNEDQASASVGREDGPTTTPLNVHLLDEEFPEHERLPRRFSIDFRQMTENCRFGTRVFYRGRQ